MSNCCNMCRANSCCLKSTKSECFHPSQTLTKSKPSSPLSITILRNLFVTKTLALLCWILKMVAPWSLSAKKMYLLIFIMLQSVLNLSTSEADSSRASMSLVMLKAKYSPSLQDSGKISPFSLSISSKTCTALRLNTGTPGRKLGKSLGGRFRLNLSSRSTSTVGAVQEDDKCLPSNCLKIAQSFFDDMTKF